MHYISFFTYIVSICALCNTQLIYESDMNFRIDPGSKTCFFEKGKTGDTMEVLYQVIDGQHGDLDISFDIINPKGVKIVSDYKKAENSIIMDLELDGDYAFCMDNSFSVMNSKLVFIYVSIEPHDKATDNEVDIATLDDNGEERKMIEVLQWMGTYDNGEHYYIDVEDIATSMTNILKHVVKARHLLDLYGALRSRDSYLAFEDTFIVDMWSSFQIIFMLLVGLLQVYTIKNLFNRSYTVSHDIFK